MWQPALSALPYHPLGSCTYRQTCTDSHFHSNPALDFVAAPALAPAEVAVDPQLMEQYQRELAQAEAVPLPDDDEDL